MRQGSAMARRKSNVIPFRPRPRQWTRPEDYRRGSGGPPRPPKRPKRDWTPLAAWALVAAIVAATVAWNVWG
jgi:hypothetical protein